MTRVTVARNGDEELLLDPVLVEIEPDIAPIPYRFVVEPWKSQVEDLYRAQGYQIVRGYVAGCWRGHPSEEFNDETGNCLGCRRLLRLRGAAAQSQMRRFGFVRLWTPEEDEEDPLPLNWEPEIIAEARKNALLFIRRPIKRKRHKA